MIFDPCFSPDEGLTDFRIGSKCRTRLSCVEFHKYVRTFLWQEQAELSDRKQSGRQHDK